MHFTKITIFLFTLSSSFSLFSGKPINVLSSNTLSRDYWKVQRSIVHEKKVACNGAMTLALLCEITQATLNDSSVTDMDIKHIRELYNEWWKEEDPLSASFVDKIATPFSTLFFEYVAIRYTLLLDIESMRGFWSTDLKIRFYMNLYFDFVIFLLDHLSNEKIALYEKKKTNDLCNVLLNLFAHMYSFLDKEEMLMDEEAAAYFKTELITRIHPYLIHDSTFALFLNSHIQIFVTEYREREGRVETLIDREVMGADNEV